MPFGITSSIIGGIGAAAGAAETAAASRYATDQQVAQQNKALEFQQQQYSTNQANESPFVSAGQTSVGSLMNGFSNGTFGPGSIPAFQAPTLEEAQQTPGYQFTQQQGEKGIERGAAAAGGAFTGGTLKSLAGYDSVLANSTYQQVFNNALSGYQTKLASQNQSFNQLSAVAGLGQNAAAQVGNSGAQAASTIGSTLTNLGATQAAGTLGGAAAFGQGVNGIASAAQGVVGGLQQLNGFTNPANIQNSNNAGAASIAANGLPTGGSYELPELPAPGVGGAG